MAITAIHTNNDHGSGSNSLSITSISLKKAARRPFAALAVVALLFFTGCSQRSMESEFYKSPRNQWPQNLSKYSYEQQWKIFLYGVSHREPPPYELTLVLAKEKDNIIAPLVGTITNSSSNSDLDGVAALLKTLKAKGFDPCSNAEFRSMPVQSALQNRVPDGTLYKC